MKSLLEQRNFIFLHVEIQGGVEQPFVTIHDVPDWNRDGISVPQLKQKSVLSEEMKGKFIRYRLPTLKRKSRGQRPKSVRRCLIWDIQKNAMALKK